MKTEQEIRKQLEKWERLYKDPRLENKDRMLAEIIVLRWVLNMEYESLKKELPCQMKSGQEIRDMIKRLEEMCRYAHQSDMSDFHKRTVERINDFKWVLGEKER